ncbi:MAG: PD-(D/E)XK nuclease family protein [candidate division WOR-3 bacterium]|jgi:ATP-dependent helicase/DNAse subunit B|nr:PD-(D/E)XK nuclease family protein [candidate division WOR-3 bacterium]MDH7518647.1 PD-(D/E)XK nuclease family protein [bacterium]
MRHLYLIPFSSYNGTEHLLKTALKTGTQPHQIFYFTPSPRKLRATQVLFARIYGKQAFIPPAFFTLRQFALKLASEYGNKRPFPEELKPLLVRQLFLRKNKKVTIGYAQVVAKFITELKRHLSPEEQAVLPERLKGMDIFAGYEKVLQRLLEAYQIMDDYNHALDQSNWWDSEDILSQAPRLLEKIPAIKVLILDSFVAPNRLEKEIIAALIDRAEHTLALGYGASDSNPGYNLARVFNDFILSHPGFSAQPLPCENNKGNTPTIWRFPTAEDEVTGICRHLRIQAERSGLKNTYVVFPRLNEYAPLANRIFRQYEIPFTIYPESPLASAPMIIAVLELLNALNTDYERVATTAAFSSPFFPGLLRLSDDSNPTVPDSGIDRRQRAAQMLNTISRRAGIIKGRANWHNIAERIIRAEELDETSPETRYLREIQQRVRQALGITEKILEPADTLGSQAHRLKQFLETVDYGTNIAPDDTVRSEMLEDRKKLYDILDTIVEFEADFGGDKETRTDFIKIISRLLSLSCKTPESDQHGVAILGMEELLGITPDNLYFAGLTENALPGAYQPDPLIPEKIRKQLGLPDIDWHRDWQRFHFHRTLCSSLNLPFLSFPETQEGNPVLPTPFLQDIEPGIAVSAPRQLEENTVIYSEIEHQRYLGKLSNVTLEQMTSSVDFSSEPQAQEVIKHRFGPESFISVTALERFRRCPFIFYLDYVLGLEIPPEPEYVIDAQQWGILLHDIFKLIYSSTTVPALNELKPKAEKLLNEILKNAGIPRFWAEVTRRVFNNILPMFIEQEERLRMEGFLPFKTELILKGTIGQDIKVKGRIDRIDSSGTAVRIIDYKTGSEQISANDVIQHRTHLQLPLYAHLLSEQKEFNEKRVDNIGFYHLHPPEVNWLAKEETSVDNLIQAAIQNTIEIVEAIRNGKFLAQPGKKNICQRCDFQFTCGYRTEAPDEKMGVK